MRGRVLLVAVLVVASGCNVFGGGPTAERGSETPTLTPAPVPEAAPLRTTPGAEECLAPRVTAPDRTPVPTPATPVPLAGENGTVGGAALVDRHTAALANHSFALRIDATEVESMPRASAFTYEGVSLGFDSIQVFSVAGTTYRLHETAEGVTISEQPYDRDSSESDWYVAVLTGTHWLTDRVGALGYRQVDTRTWNGTEVRVLRDTFDGEAVVDIGTAVSINSTVFVDRRGVIRYVRHVRTTQSDESDDIAAATEVETFTVTDVGTVTVSRPEAFCVASSTVAGDNTATPTPSVTALQDGTVRQFTAVPGPSERPNGTG
ncbi:hypothetical protein BRD06_10490 [Halobacteriales archaeon QS_9_67_15]|nr:MAG: hypothetical protein BRD06_10490 [Halobacteriales archaeon QS_9_67_15]